MWKQNGNIHSAVPFNSGISVVNENAYQIQHIILAIISTSQDMYYCTSINQWVHKTHTINLKNLEIPEIMVILWEQPFHWNNNDIIVTLILLFFQKSLSWINCTCSCFCYLFLSLNIVTQISVIALSIMTCIIVVLVNKQLNNREIIYSSICEQERIASFAWYYCSWIHIWFWSCCTVLLSVIHCTLFIISQILTNCTKNESVFNCISITESVWFKIVNPEAAKAYVTTCDRVFYKKYGDITYDLHIYWLDIENTNAITMEKIHSCIFINRLGSNRQ